VKHTQVELGAGMEWRQQSAVSCELAFEEAQRWLEVMTSSNVLLAVGLFMLMFC